MKILYLTVGSPLVASSRTRVYQYLPHLQQQAIEATVLSGQPEWARRISLYRIRTPDPWRKIVGAIEFGPMQLLSNHIQRRNLAKAIRLAPQYSLVFIQKLVLPESFYARLLQAAKYIVFDIDDAIYAGKQHTRRERIEQQMQTCDLMIVSTEHLAKHAAQYNQKVLVLPTPIDTDHYVPSDTQSKSELEDAPVTIGWIGSPSSSHYLNPIIPIFSRLQDEYKDRIQIVLVGADPRQVRFSRVQVHPWRLETERALLQTFDIGVMPLPRSDEWASGKAGYKLLQYMAVGIPCVASPVGPNTMIVEHGGNGFLAETAEEWMEALRTLITSAELRRRMGRYGRNLAEADYSHRSMTINLVQALDELTSADEASRQPDTVASD